MTVRTRAQLNSDADTFIPDQTAGAVSPQDVRDRIKDLADSARLAEDVLPMMKASSSGPASMEFAEDTDNGSNKVTVIAPASLSADATVTLPTRTGALALLSDASRPNRLNNPAFQVSQENGNTLGAVDGYYPADELFMTFVASTAAMSVQRVQSRSLKGSLDQIEWKCTTAKASLGASDFVALRTKIEGQKMADLQWGTAGAQPYVYEFQTTRPAGLYHIHVTNSAGNRHIAVPYTISAPEANTPVRKTVVIPGDTSGTWLVDNGVGAVIDDVIAAGSTVTGGTLGAWGSTTYYAQSTQKNGLDSTSNVVRIADRQLCADPLSTGVAPPWELPILDDAERRCMRYWEQLDVYIGSGFNGVGSRGYRPNYLTRKRVASTPTFSGSGGPTIDIVTVTGYRIYNATGNEFLGVTTTDARL